MNETKQKILNESLKLFNENGISNVALRTIAGTLGISVGNLQYHFKKREDIIETLYFQLVEKMDSLFVIGESDVLKSFFTISTEMISILYDYHFFFLDFVAITRNNETLKKHYSKLSKRREESFLVVADVLIKKGLFREELLKNEYQNLFKRVEVLTNFWFSSIFIQSEVLTKESLDEYSLVVGQSIFPYLTDEAKNQYAKMFPAHML